MYRSLSLLILSLFVSLSTFSNDDEFFRGYNGVNLAGAEFGESAIPGIQGRNYEFPTTAELDYFKSKGIKLVRIPFLWERIQRTVGGDLATTYLNELKKITSAAEERGVYVLLDCHNYGGYHINGVEYKIGSDEVTADDFGEFWKKMATEFKDYTNIWGYGLMNEPNAMNSSTDWKKAAVKAIFKIREVDTKNAIVVGGDDWSSAARWKSKSANLAELLKIDDNLIFEAHLYFDADHSGRYTSSYDANNVYKEVGIDRVKPFIDFLKENNAKGVLGEYGVPGDDDRYLAVIDTFLTYLEANCVPSIYWAAGPWWGNYSLSVEPNSNGSDKPQMAVLENHTHLTWDDCGDVLFINEFMKNEYRFSVYPNPTNGELFLDVYTDWEILNLQGDVLLEGRGKEIAIEDLPEGMYLLRFEGETHKVLKQ